jgi:CheY-like chemotaxis protein
MTSENNTVAVVVGKIVDYEKGFLRAAASRAGTALAFYANVEEACSGMKALAETPRCVLVAHGEPLDSLVDWMRSRVELFSVPVVALVSYPADGEYRQAYAQGADDVLVTSDAGGITRRLANLQGRRPGARPPANKGEAIVACQQINQRRLLGRSLRQAGFEVCFAEGAYELVEIARTARSLALVVVTADFPPLGAEPAVRAVRNVTDNPTLPAMVIPEDEKGCGKISPVTGSEQAGKVLFFADELLSGKGKEQRASRRLLFHTICSFREAGAMESLYGLTHNISREGLYVRTLDPPEPGCELWLEMRDPRDGAGMHLRGRVVWRREPSVTGGAAPPGFGLRIEAEQCPPEDLKRYVCVYEETSRTASDEIQNAFLEAV